jgi:hypothetical protein
MSLQTWTSHFYLLVHEYNHQVREVRRCRNENDLGEIGTGRGFYTNCYLSNKCSWGLIHFNQCFDRYSLVDCITLLMSA